MKAIMVHNDGGIYQINPNAEPQDWESVRAAVEAHGGTVERVEYLVGWGDWREAWQACVRGRFQTYFVTREEVAE